MDVSTEHLPIVVGAIGRSGLAGILIGSTALDLPGLSHCPVVVVRTRTDGSDAMDGSVVVGAVGSQLDESATGFAFDQASARGAELLVMHAWSDAPMPDRGRLGGQSKDWIAFFERERQRLSYWWSGHGGAGHWLARFWVRRAEPCSNSANARSRC